jgi:cardiolipin synthase
MAENAAYIPSVPSCPYPARAGNRVRPLINAAAAFGRIGEAIDAARHSIWLSVTFYADDFRFPDGRSLFDALDQAVGRGVDVRVLFWRHNPESSAYGRTFWGTVAEREMLRTRQSRVRIRWDRAAAAFAQHQKCWLIDAGRASETSFVGGINLTAQAFRRHDAYVEVTGPSATDVHRNFVQRWNDASERYQPDGNWTCDSSDALPDPSGETESRGASTVQIQRMLYPGLYASAIEGERSILEQYRRAIDAARRTIYIENQAIPQPVVAERLQAALARGVSVVFLVPSILEDWAFAARRDPTRRALFEGLEALGHHPAFRLVGVAVQDGTRRRPVYTHGKLMLVDDVWATIGSCNLHHGSLSGNSEMNASIWDAEVARGLRQDLFGLHLDKDTSALDDVSALRLYREIADDNRRRHVSGGIDWQGQIFALEPRSYAAAQAH